MSIFIKVSIGFGLLTLGYLIRWMTSRSKTPAVAKESWFGRIFENNRDLDSTIAMGFTFLGFLMVLGAVSALLLRSLAVPTELWNVVNMFENFVLMILSSFFTKATMSENNGGKP